MLFFALFLAGFTLGVFTALYVFRPESREEIWDPQSFPVPQKYSAIIDAKNKTYSLKSLKPTVAAVK